MRNLTESLFPFFERLTFLKVTIHEILFALFIALIIALNQMYSLVYMKRMFPIIYENFSKDTEIESGSVPKGI